MVIHNGGLECLKVKLIGEAKSKFRQYGFQDKKLTGLVKQKAFKRGVAVDSRFLKSIPV